MSPERDDRGLALRVNTWEPAVYVRPVPVEADARLTERYADYDQAEVEYESDGRKDITWWKPLEHQPSGEEHR